MRDTDLADVARLCAQLGYPSDVRDVAERFVRLTDSDRDAVFIAHDAVSVIGWLHLHATVTLESDAYVEIGGVVVDEAARGQGVGRALMAEADRWATARGIDRVRLRTNVVRTQAHAFYERLGFRRLKTQYTYEKRCAP